MTMIYLVLANGEKLCTPLHRLEMVRPVESTRGDAWYLELTDEPFPRYCREEPSIREQIPAISGFYGLTPYQDEDGLAEWGRFPVVAWQIERGLVTGQELDVHPVFAPAGSVMKEDHKHLVLVDLNSRQACQLKDDCWQPDLMAVMARALNLPGLAMVTEGVDPWQQGVAPLKTRRG